MSAPDLLIKHPDLHKTYTDSRRRFNGYDCTDNNDKAAVNSQHGKDPMSGALPTATAAAEVIPTSTAATTAATATTSTQQQMDLNREEVRLVTFDNENWDVPFLNKSKLAQIGFYYIGPQDTVKCYFCRVEIGKWEAEDDCFTEHSRWSPSCPLLRRQQTDNVPIDAEQLNQILPPITYDTCGTNGGMMIRPNAYAERSFTPTDQQSNEQTSTASSMRSSPVSPEEMSSSRSSPFRFTSTGQSAPLPHIVAGGQEPHQQQPHTAGGLPMLATMNQMYGGSELHGNAQSGNVPAYFNPLTTPHLEIEANRLRTFKEWPINLKMKPVQLSDAGFFYTGVGDRVQCFSCGGGLKNWEDDDVAWEQHALWYPNCEYLKLIKGQKYIELVKQMHDRKQQIADGGEVEDSSEEESVGEELTAESFSGRVSVEIEDEAPLPRRVPRRQHDAMPSTSRSSAGGAEVIKISRSIGRRRLSRMGSGSHPESDPCSAEAVLAAKSAKPSEVPESKLCKICYECEFNTAFIPCGHVVACAKCASAVTACPMCREPFDSVTRIYFS